MAHWLASLFFGSIAFGLAFMVGTELRLDSKVWMLGGVLLWLALGMLLTSSSRFADDVTEPAGNSPEEAAPIGNATVAEDSVNEQSLHAAVVQLTKELRAKEIAIERLQTKLTEREFRRSLSRLATIHETLVFTLNLLAQGKLAHSEAVEQLRQEVEAAVSDLGLEHHAIQVGAQISSLPLGSFIILRSEAAPSPALAGTVREVVSNGLCARDEDGKPHFISPSKINAYKL
jgi:hypothetical protein